MEDLISLNGGNLPAADPHLRQQLTQEFFFHLLGAIEVLAQLVNEVREFGLDVESASISEVVTLLRSDDPLREALDALYVRSEGAPLPTIRIAAMATSFGSGTTATR
jgi:hypothetical protein